MVLAKEKRSRPDILIVEDNVALQHILTQSLEKYGISTTSAVDGDSALYSIIKNKPRVVLLDILIPKTSGLELLRTLRKHSWGKLIPVIVLTNLDDIEAQNKCVVMGVKNHYIKCNTSMSQIVAIVRSRLKEGTSLPSQ